MRKINKRSVFVLVLTLLISILSGCNAAPETGYGDFIISKEDQRILVAKKVSQEDAASKTHDELKQDNIEIINYIVEDLELYNELEAGEQVNVTPKTSANGAYIVMKSDPPQIVAGQIERLRD
ncbi:DUF3221 domain-containing protein [Paenibacillus sp. EC2-1]|uniref:DUF3221 domain-containing protein n=1 Tax=Paenibacillus sp. EC2-1 TaxID=3388665 RepID=UPI003BEF016A